MTCLQNEDLKHDALPCEHDALPIVVLALVVLVNKSKCTAEACVIELIDMASEEEPGAKRHANAEECETRHGEEQQDKEVLPFAATQVKVAGPVQPLW